MKLRARIGKKASKELLEFTSSLDYDLTMLLEDIWGSEAHVIMLSKQGIIAKSEGKRILSALENARKDFLKGRFNFLPELEDIHLNLENYVAKKAGKAGGKLHTARSRNDQVQTALRLHLRARILSIKEAILQLENSLVKLGGKFIRDPLPGYTHLQQAQPITLGFWASSWLEALERDQDRLSNAYSCTNLNPLGACALAGTSFPIDRKLTARLLGFPSLVENSMDAVSTRDYILELISSLAILMSNISRIAEDLILWSSSEFSLVELPPELTTGSSVMPQKKNPDPLELIRGKTGLVYGNLVQALTLVKALPSSYSRDLQEDRAMLWTSLSTVESSTRILATILGGMKFNKKRALELMDKSFMQSTELANLLVREKGMDFRSAYSLVGGIVKDLSRKGKSFKAEDIQKILKRKRISIDEKKLKKALSPDGLIKAYRSQGSSSPKSVKRMLQKSQKKIREEKSEILKARNSIKKAHELTKRMIKRL